jgi:hypothetical protein
MESLVEVEERTASQSLTKVIFCIGPVSPLDRGSDPHQTVTSQ